MSAITTDPVARTNAAIDEALRSAPAADRVLPSADLLPGSSSLTVADAFDLFAAMVTSRALDVAGRALKAQGAGYYTIASAGHELNAVLGAALRPDDPCFLHYRSGGLMIARQLWAASDRDAARRSIVRDVLLSMAAAADDPVAQGRHKVWGSRDLWVPPQTSTIASHLPKATGTAFAIQRAAKIGHALELPADAIAVASFGDASANHASALTGINAARYAARRGAGAPILFVCEDNGIGISVETPSRWIASSFGDLPHLHYVRAEGDLATVHATVRDAIERCRERRAPVFLHLPTTRLWGHAGSDVEMAYRSAEAIAAAEAADPIPAVAAQLLARGVATRERLAATVADIRREVARVADEVAGAPTLPSREAVVAPLAPHDPTGVRDRATAGGPNGLPAAAAPARRARTLAQALRDGLAEALDDDPGVLLFGEDVGRKGGVYGVTTKLQQAAGHWRVFDTLLDETTILGTAQGAALLGMLPIPEIQYLAYLHNAIDQLRGEAASLSFFSNGQFANPMVIRVAGLAYQKGFGGHFHNDNGIGALLDVPGLRVVVPSHPDDAAAILRTARAMARVNGNVVVMLEPIALYHERDLHTEGDGGWLTTGDGPQTVLPGEFGVTRHAADGDERRGTVVLTYGNGHRMARRVAARVHRDTGAPIEVVDLRWIAPLPRTEIRDAVRGADAVLVVDEARHSSGIADAVIATITESAAGGWLGVPVASVRSADAFVPLGPAADHVLLQESEILGALSSLVARP